MTSFFPQTRDEEMGQMALDMVLTMRVLRLAKLLNSIPQVTEGGVRQHPTGDRWGGQTGDIQYLAGIGVSSNSKLPLITKHPL